MRFWVDKENEMFPNKEWDGAYIFTLIRRGYSTIFTNIADIWYRMDQLTIPVACCQGLFNHIYTLFKSGAERNA